MKNNHPIPQKTERAQSLVEFAISLLLILMILTGAVEVSLALFEYVTISNAAQEGALYGSIYPKSINHAAIRARVVDAANDGLALTDSEIEIGALGSGFCEKTASGVTNQIRVTIIHPHRIVMPFASSFLGTQIPMTVSATNTILQPACDPPP
ncbi:MAG: pilus assembly protein [Anaerolineales bacterium]|nr:pilus assembly protein [Anaerolineales bacterium]